MNSVLVNIQLYSLRLRVSACGFVFSIESVAKGWRMIFYFTLSRKAAKGWRMNSVLIKVPLYSLRLRVSACGFVFSIESVANGWRMMFYFTQSREAAKGWRMHSVFIKVIQLYSLHADLYFQ